MFSEEILNYFSRVDNEIIEEKYKRSVEENDRIEIDLSNPNFFLPKLHTVF